MRIAQFETLYKWSFFAPNSYRRHCLGPFWSYFNFWSHWKSFCRTVRVQPGRKFSCQLGIKEPKSQSLRFIGARDKCTDPDEKFLSSLVLYKPSTANHPSRLSIFCWYGITRFDHLLFLTPQVQLSLQKTFGVWTDVKVFWTNSDEEESGM